MRHEGSHALAAVLGGSEITRIRLLPGIHDELGFYFGYVEYSGEANWLTDAAPFIADILLLTIAAILLARVVRATRWRFLLLLFGIISPLVDLVYGYFSGLWREGSDVADLLAQLHPIPVHLFFIAAIASAFVLMRRLHGDP